MSIHSTMPFLGLPFQARIEKEIRPTGAMDQLRMLCNQAMEDNDPLIRDRLDRELGGIHHLGLGETFLALVDIHDFARSKGHVLTLTGVAVGSLVVHLLGLSHLNPVDYKLSYERLLDPSITFGPQFSFAINKGGPEDVVRYAREKFCWDDLKRKEFDYAAYSREWQHPSGGDIKRITIDVVEDPCLTILKKTRDWILKNQGIQGIPQRIPDKDAKTMALFHNNQIEDLDPRIAEVSQKCKPEGITDLTAVSCIRSLSVVNPDAADQFIKQRQEQQPLSYIHSGLEDILVETCGVLLYQDQVIEILTRYGGLIWGEGLQFIKASRIKKEEIIEAFKQQFLRGALARNISLEVAQSIFNMLAKEAHRTWPKSTEMIRATKVYQLVYLKAHYPLAFAAADARGIYAAFDAEIREKLKDYFVETKVTTEVT